MSSPSESKQDNLSLTREDEGKEFMVIPGYLVSLRPDWTSHKETLLRITSVKQWNEEQESSMFSGMKLERTHRDNKGYKCEKDASSKRKEGSTCRHTGGTLWYELMECPLTS